MKKKADTGDDMLKVINWNIRFISSWWGKDDFLRSLVGDDPYCIILEEVTSETWERIQKTWGDSHTMACSLTHRPRYFLESAARDLGVAILCSLEVTILEHGVVERALMPERTLWATLSYEGKQVKVLGSHALSASAYWKGKSLQFESLWEFCAGYQPDIIGMDANDPQEDSFDVEKMVFQDLDGAYGSVAFFRWMLNSGDMADAFVKANGITDGEAGKPLATSYRLYDGKEVRYDFLFVKNRLPLTRCVYLFDAAIQAGSDHGVVMAEFDF